jgi:Sulfotransferase family
MLVGPPFIARHWWALRPYRSQLRHGLRDLRWRARRPFAVLRDQAAAEFYDRVHNEAYFPNERIDLLADQRLIFIANPKVAQSRIRATLREVADGLMASPSCASKVKRPRDDLTLFHRLATDPAALRFAFVRNPYDRLVSCWANKFKDKPLVVGDFNVEDYLRAKRKLDEPLPEGPERTLSFAEFAVFAAATADGRVDMHWQLQSDLIEVPGVALNFIGKFEAFQNDFARVLDYLGTGPEMKCAASQRLNVSRHGSTVNYYTAELADRVYRAYERDFDRFGYSRKLPA